MDAKLAQQDQSSAASPLCLWLQSIWCPLSWHQRRERRRRLPTVSPTPVDSRVRQRVWEHNTKAGYVSEIKPFDQECPSSLR